VGLGNRYPRQLLNKAVHKVLFSNSTVKLLMLTMITVHRMKLDEIAENNGSGWSMGNQIGRDKASSQLV
jgi:hypothetical protein